MMPGDSETAGLRSATDKRQSVTLGANTGRGRPAGLARKLALALASLALVLAGLEVATRLFSRVSPPLLCNDATVGTTFLPGFSGLVYVPERGGEVSLRFNREGVRGVDFAIEKPANVRRVAVIGDSMIAAIASDEEQTLVHRLESQLNEKSAAARWEVMNFGVSGSSTGQELVLYRERVRKYQPDFVVCAFCVANDLGDNCTQLTSSRSRIYFDIDDRGELVELPFLPARARLTSWLNRRSRFYVWQKDATQNAINAIRNQAVAVAARSGRAPVPIDSGGQGIFCADPSDAVARAWLVTEKLIDTMSRDARAAGAEFALAVLPTGWQVSDEIWSRVVAGAAGVPLDLHQPDRKLAEICARLDVPVVLMTEQFRAAAGQDTSPQSPAMFHYAGVGHFNDRGNELAAQILSSAIQEIASGQNATPSSVPHTVHHAPHQRQ